MQINKDRLIYLINYLINEQSVKIDIPKDENEQKLLLRKLMNVRKPNPVDDEFLQIQDEYLQEEILNAGIVDIKDLKPVKENIYLWHGDITCLKVDAIVNAACLTPIFLQ